MTNNGNAYNVSNTTGLFTNNGTITGRQATNFQYVTSNNGTMTGEGIDIHGGVNWFLNNSGATMPMYWGFENKLVNTGIETDGVVMNYELFNNSTVVEKGVKGIALELNNTGTVATTLDVYNLGMTALESLLNFGTVGNGEVRGIYNQVNGVSAPGDVYAIRNTLSNNVNSQLNVGGNLYGSSVKIADGSGGPVS